MKIGKGPKSSIKLNDQILEETESYKYLGELFNIKGNMAAHIKTLEGKIHAATQNIIAETGNREFKGIKMQAIWQMAEAILIPILTYGAESWDLSKKEAEQVQTIFNKAIKTIMFMPSATPTTILLTETGFIPIEQVIDQKRIMQARRISEKPDSSLIKRLTPLNNSLWQAGTQKLLIKYNIEQELIEGKKGPLLRKINSNKVALIKRKIATETEEKTKTKHWAQLKDTIEPSKRPDYMNKLNRKQCNAILKTRSSMLPVKNNQKSQYSTDLTCRFCRQQEENQEHILQDCNSVPGNDTKKLAYREIFKDKDHKTLGKAADRIIEIIAILEETRTGEQQ